ncbi:MAG: hypothetical protein K8S22_07705 [Betaproteobacteria bacterium]|nr:hypothetical protein [Betaproteobacteria bacterium]
MSIDDPHLLGSPAAKPTQSEVFDTAVFRASSFAKVFSLIRDDICMFHGQAPGAPDRCSSFGNFGDEGIRLDVHYSSESQVTAVVLVKEARVFGKYSKGEVQEAFERLVASPLTAEFGSRVRVQQ